MEATAQILEFPTKVCNACGEAKAHSEFYTKSDGKGGRRLNHMCKPCDNKHEHARRGTQKPFFRMDDVRKLDDEGNLTEKRCPTCETWKTPDQFYNNKKGTHGVGNHCKSCVDKKYFDNMARNPDFMRNKNMINLYGITLSEVRQILINQHGLCANRACGRAILVDTAHGNKDKAFVDHSHSTGKVRGLLCISCNTALGLLEQKNKMVGLTEYLQRTDI